MTYRTKIEVSDEKIPPLTLEYQVMSLDDGRLQPRTVTVCREDPIRLSVNRHPVVRQTMSPDNLAEFACGYLIGEGIISGVDQIESIRIAFPEVAVKVCDFDDRVLLRSREISASGGVEFIPDTIEPRRKLSSKTSVHRDTIFAAMTCLNDYAVLWRETGGTHCTVLFDADGGVIAHAEDIGRHNSVDKIIGKALLSGIDPGHTFISCSGRMPAGMVGKIWRSGIPIIVTNNAPSAKGIDLARAVNLTLAGFVRPPRMVIYSGADRIRF
jgi:FdhD protein